MTNMKKGTKTTLRLVSIVLALLLVLMEVGAIPNLFNYHFWVLIIAYALIVVTVR